MKYKKRLILFLIIIFVLLLSLSGVAEEIPRITFTNKSTENICLYCTKQVESAIVGYSVPSEDTFTFTLKLNGSLAKETIYQLYDKSGREIFNYEGTLTVQEDTSKIATPFKTDRYGRFTLRADETACFPDLSSGMSYEIIESSKDRYIQTVPSGGVAAVGTTTNEGATVLFKNTYIPVTTTVPDSTDPTIPGDSKDSYTTLEVQKDIAFPQGYEIPETPNFTFLITVDNKAYANEVYTIINTENGEEVSTGKTDAEGKCIIPGGCKAVFSSVPVDVDYEVSEVALDGWRAVGSTSKEGATSYPLTLASFTNAEASFVVTKQLHDFSSSNEKFTFVLTDKDGITKPGVSYYLYKTTGERINDKVYKTDSLGNFSLQPGQAAIFIGLDKNEEYGVKEYANGEYVQKVPVSSEGYTGKKVNDSIEVLPFINEKVERKDSLSVTKVVRDISDEGIESSKTFTFFLEKKNDETYEPVTNAVYGVADGSGTSTYQTDENGSFQLVENKTACFENLENGTYRVREELTAMPEDYYVVGEEAFEGDLSDEPAFTITNRFGEIENISVSGKKTWMNDVEEDRPDSITINLLQNGEQITSTTTSAEANWEYTFDNVPKLDNSLNPYEYTVSEEVVDGYSPIYDGMDVVNNKAIDIEGVKIWVGDTEETRPEKITIHLLQNDKKYLSKEITAADDWEYVFENVPEKDENGTAYIYTIQEETIDEYITEYDGFNIYNILSTDISGTKIWEEDSVSDRPSEITVNLLQDGEVYLTTTSSSASGWTYSFENVPVSDRNGNIYEYTIEELPVENYLVTYEGFDIINTWNDKKLEGEKIWANDTEADRPESITVRLLQDGEEYRTLTTSATTNWKYRFEGLPIYKERNVEYDYSIKEVPVEGYKVSYSETTTKGLEITFNALSNSESVSWDYVIIYYELDGQTYQLGKWGGTSLANLTVQVPTTDFYLWWHTDGSGNGYYGFSIDSIVPKDVAIPSSGTTASLPSYTVSEISGSNYPETAHNPYPNSQNLVWHYTVSGGAGIQIVNTKLTEEESAKIQISKVNRSGELLANAKLQLLDADGNIVYEWVSETSPEVIYGLIPGTYTIHELQAPEGYLVASDQEITVADVTTVQEFTYVNKSAPQNIPVYINKTGENGAMLEGAKFGLYDAQTDVKISEAISDENGTVTFRDVTCRKEYYIKEEEAPTGYKLLEEEINFIIYEDAEIMEEETGSSLTENQAYSGPIAVVDGTQYYQSSTDSDVTAPAYFATDAVSGTGQALYLNVENEPKPNNYIVYITKVNNSGTALSGAEFVIYSDAECTTKVSEGTSDTNGKVTFTDLEYDTTYYIKEEKSPAGYQLLTNPISVVFDSDTSEAVVDGNAYSADEADTSADPIYVAVDTNGDAGVYIKVTNHKGFELPLTGGTGIILTVMISIIGIAFIIFLMLRHKDKK